MRRTCEVDGCGEPFLARGMCESHYHKARTAGTIVCLRPKPVNAGGCSVDDCRKPAFGRGYCQAHYCKLRKYGDPLGKAAPKTGHACSVSGCNGIVIARGLCASCYSRAQKRGTTEYSSWFKKREEDLVDNQGYVQVYLPEHPNARKSGRIPKHRLVISKALGRALLPGENVHHRNGVRADNSRRNLELWVTTQPCGQRPRDLVEWAQEILRRYPPEVLKRLR